MAISAVLAGKRSARISFMPGHSTKFTTELLATLIQCSIHFRVGNCAPAVHLLCRDIGSPAIGLNRSFAGWR